MHGFAEHSGRYDELGAWLARRGAAVHAYDHRGHGRSAHRGLGRSGRFGDLVADLLGLLDRVHAEAPDRPLILVGHSMGGLVAAAALAGGDPPVDLAALSAPALSLSPDLSGPRLWAARWLGRLLPRARASAGLDPAGLSRDFEVVRRYQEDPLVFTRIEAGFAADMLRAIPRTAARADAVGCPVLLLHGGSDPICSPRGSESFHAGLRTQGSDLRIYPDLRHEIFNEPERHEIFEELQGWIEDREAKIHG